MGTIDQRVNAAVFAGTYRVNTHAHCELCVLLGRSIRHAQAAHHSEQAAGQIIGLRSVLAWQEHSKLIATKAGKLSPPPPHFSLKEPREFDQHLIPTQIAVGLIVGLESVEVEQHQRYTLCMISGPLPLLLHALEEHPPGRQSGEGVSGREARL